MAATILCRVVAGGYQGSAPASTAVGNPAPPVLLATVVKIADILGVTLDELAGRKDAAEPQIHNPELHRLYKKVDLLSDEDQQALVIALDSLVKRSRVRRVMTE